MTTTELERLCKKSFAIDVVLRKKRDRANDCYSMCILTNIAFHARFGRSPVTEFLIQPPHLSSRFTTSTSMHLFTFSASFQAQAQAVKLRLTPSKTSTGNNLSALLPNHVIAFGSFEKVKTGGYHDKIFGTRPVVNQI
jgi:hypothetical protein